MNKSHWHLNWSAFCQRKFCVWLYFQRAENVLMGSSVNSNELGCQNTIKTIWSPLCPTSLWFQSLSKLSKTLLGLRSYPLRTEMSALLVHFRSGQLLGLFILILYSLHWMKSPLAIHSVNCHSIRLPLDGGLVPESCPIIHLTFKWWCL